MHRCAAVASSALFAASAAAQVALHPLFGDHAVLQRGRPILVRGTAQAGEAVTVSFGEARAAGRAGADGVFVVPLPAQPANGEPARLVAEAPSGRAESADVLVGDVWLCSGQSNMEFPLEACRDDADVAAADHPGIRHFGVEMRFATLPQPTLRGRWQPCRPDRARGFTAVGHHFAVRVHAATGVPIGLLRAAIGGTNIECWMAQDTLLGDAALAPYAERMRASLARQQQELAAALPTIADWTRRSEAARAAGAPLPPPPEWPEHPFGERRHDPRCTTLHNGMIAPLQPFAVRGALWYQGENNTGSRADGDQYIAKMQALARDWQAWFGGADFLFLYVQLAAWRAPTDDPGAEDDWAQLRDAQRRAHGLGPLRMASAIDVGDADDIHPRNKADVGARLAAWALREAYGQDVVPCGPLVREAARDGGRVRIRFDHVGGGLVVGRKLGRAPMVVDDAPLRRFAIAGADRTWHWATARIDGAEVVVGSPDVPEPRYVRYAWAANPEGANLYCREGFPASPFAVETASPPK
jgi:sialate O-acetylesterase